MQSYVFGPVPSRRLGRSLGVDLVPFKTCSYDCIYCQLGRTTCKTVTRKEWVPLNRVLEQLREKLVTKPDYITLSGSGEPTLFAKIGELISGIKTMTDIPVAVLTNGSMLWMPEVRHSLLQVDLMIPSLDASGEELFQYVNKPVDSISFERMVEGLIVFRNEFRGRYWLEVFLLEGVTGLSTEVQKIAMIANRINPDRIHLNTVSRPPAESFALPVYTGSMEAFARMFGKRTEVIADYFGTGHQREFTASGADVLDMLRRRPCTAEDIARGLGMDLNVVIKHLAQLSNDGLVDHEVCNHRMFHTVIRTEAETCPAHRKGWLKATIAKHTK